MEINLTPHLLGNSRRVHFSVASATFALFVRWRGDDGALKSKRRHTEQLVLLLRARSALCCHCALGLRTAVHKFIHKADLFQQLAHNERGTKA